MPLSITGSVGEGGENLPEDVRSVQRLLNRNLYRLTPLSPLEEDGLMGPATLGAINAFQERVLHFARPDGRVDPDGRTLAELNACQDQPAGRELTDADYQMAARRLSVDVATIKAVASVESRGEGFLSNGEPKILFEGHWFSKFTGGRYDHAHPSISYPRWTKQHYRGGIAEYQRYRQAEALDAVAAMKSTSWGAFQIMGFNHAAAGHPTVESFVHAMRASASDQLLALADFIRDKNLAGYLQSRDWKAFARRYNGPAYAQNRYDEKLEQAYRRFSAGQ